MCHITRTIAAGCSHPITEDLDTCPPAESNGLPCEEAPSLTVEEFQYPGKCHMCQVADSEREEQAHLQSAQHHSHQEWQTHASQKEEDELEKAMQASAAEAQQRYAKMYDDHLAAAMEASKRDAPKGFFNSPREEEE